MKETEKTMNDKEREIHEYFYPPPKPCCDFHANGGKAMDLCDWQLHDFGHRNREAYEEWKKTLT